MIIEAEVWYMGSTSGVRDVVGDKMKQERLRVFAG